MTDFRAEQLKRLQEQRELREKQERQLEQQQIQEGFEKVTRILKLIESGGLYKLNAEVASKQVAAFIDAGFNHDDAVKFMAAIFQNSGGVSLS